MCPWFSLSQKMAGATREWLFFFPQGTGFPDSWLYLANKNVPVTEDAKKRVSAPQKSKQKTQPKSANPETWTPPTARPKKRKEKTAMRLSTNPTIDHRMAAGASQAKGLSVPSAVIGTEPAPEAKEKGNRPAVLFSSTLSAIPIAASST